jgi:hypothetical protein
MLADHRYRPCSPRQPSISVVFLTLSASLSRRAYEHVASRMRSDNCVRLWLMPRRLSIHAETIIRSQPPQFRDYLRFFLVELERIPVTGCQPPYAVGGQTRTSPYIRVLSVRLL